MGTAEEKKTSLKVEIIEKIAALLTFAFGLVAALAWNSTMQTIFKTAFGEAESITPMVVYAIIVTIIAVIVTIFIARVKAKAVPEPSKKE